MSSIGSNVSTAFSNEIYDRKRNVPGGFERKRTHLETMKSAYTNAGGGIKGIMAGTMAGVQSITSSALSTINTVTGGGLDSMKAAYTNAGGGIKVVLFPEQWPEYRPQLRL